MPNKIKLMLIKHAQLKFKALGLVVVDWSTNFHHFNTNFGSFEFSFPPSLFFLGSFIYLFVLGVVGETPLKVSFIVFSGGVRKFSLAVEPECLY